MHIFTIILIATGLAMDAFAVSLAAASMGYARGARPAFRLAFHFGLFQFFMPILGWLLGISVVGFIEHVSHWIAFGLLAFVGGKMVYGYFQPADSAFTKNPTKGMALVVLSIATSIDALAIGLSLAVLKVGIIYPCIMIGVITSFLSLVAIYIGNKLNNRFGKIMELVGGVILIGIGVKILVQGLG
ncbi:MAG: manganese efflux pump [Fibrobacteria bacterium]|nr:manganese efflux pump [Fibrobacteria bacterium]